MTDDKILLLGDVHGEGGWLRLAIRTASALGITRILQVGDFGFWPHYGTGRQFLNNASELLVENGIELWWIDGNHENHDILEAQQRDDDGFWHLGPIVHIGRGSRWVWSGRTFLGCGGAYSIDKNYRTEGQSWWSGETITEADLMNCGTTSVDVLVTHDCPWGVTGTFGPGTVGDKDNYPESAANRKRVAALCDTVQPRLLVHGHYHHRNSSIYKNTQIEGFGRDGDARGAMGVLNLEDLTVDSINPYKVLDSKRGPVETFDDEF